MFKKFVNSTVCGLPVGVVSVFGFLASSYFMYESAVRVLTQAEKQQQLLALLVVQVAWTILGFRYSDLFSINISKSLLDERESIDRRRVFEISYRMLTILSIIVVFVVTAKAFGESGIEIKLNSDNFGPVTFAPIWLILSMPGLVAVFTGLPASGVDRQKLRNAKLKKMIKDNELKKSRS